MENEFKHKAICIKSTDNGEADRMITILSEDVGKIKAKMKGVKKGKAKLAFASFPFCFGEYLWVKRGDFCTITNCNFIDNFSGIVADMNKYYAGCSALEFINLVTKENQESNKLFVLLLRTLNALTYKKDLNIYCVLSKFIIDLLVYTGYGINVKIGNQNNSCFFDFESGSVNNVKTISAYLLSERELESLIYLCKVPFQEIDFSSVVPKNILKLLVEFYEYRTDEKISIAKQFYLN